MSDLITSVEDAHQRAKLGSWFWARQDVAPTIARLLRKPWYSLRHGEIYNGEKAVCFVHPARMTALTRVMDGKEIAEEEAAYMEAAYGPTWFTLGPEWTSTLYERRY